MFRTRVFENLKMLRFRVFSKFPVHKAKRFHADLVRNIAVIAHIDAGKTTTTEALLHNSGKKAVKGSVGKGQNYL